MKKYYLYPYIIVKVFLLILVLLSCHTGQYEVTKTGNIVAEKQQPIMVYAAASLTDVLSEIIDSFQVKSNIVVQTNIASSGTLARQVELGGTADIYISASKQWANYLDSLGFIIRGYKKEIVQNELVLIAPLNSSLIVNAIDSSLDFTSLLGKDYLSIGDPAHVPAGKYAKQSLQYFGWYKKLKGSILPAKDVRSALMVVEMEESPLGIVYRTDAQKSEKVKILNTFPEESHKPIVYVVGLCKEKAAAKNFYKFISSGGTKTIWEKYGFKK